MSEKRISHEQYLACALYQFAGENPLGTFESQEILNKLKPIEISDTLSRSFFHVCASLWAQNLAVDLGSIISGVKEFQIGAEKVMFLSDMHYTTSSWEYHLQELTEIIQKTALLSGLKRELSESGTKTASEIKSTLESLVSDNEIEADSLVKVEDVEEELFGEKKTVIPTCVDALDAALGGGFAEGQMVVIACRPGHGKTSFASQIVVSRMKEQLRSIIFNMEMGGTSIYTRLIAQNSGMALGYIENCRSLGPQAVDNVMQQWNLVKNKVTIHSKGSMSISDLKQGIQADIFKCEREGLSRPSLVIVDYLHLLKSDIGGDNLNARIGALSRGLKELAINLKVCITVLSQMSRDIEKREDQSPKLSDLRDSGAIEADANKIIFINRPAMFSSEKVERNQEGQYSELIVEKNREGAIGSVPTSFFPKSGRWT